MACSAAGSRQEPLAGACWLAGAPGGRRLGHSKALLPRRHAWECLQRRRAARRVVQPLSPTWLPNPAAAAQTTFATMAEGNAYDAKAFDEKMQEV